MINSKKEDERMCYIFHFKLSKRIGLSVELGDKHLEQMNIKVDFQESLNH